MKVNTTLLGGGFGRKAEADFITDAVLLAMAVPGRPVKVTWSREDDVRHGKYRPLTAQHVRVGLDNKGGIAGWRHRIVAQSIYARVAPAAFERSGGKDGTVTDGLDFNYHVPDRLVEYIRQDDGQDVGFWRGVAHGYTKFAVECMIDEVAAAAGADPLAFRLGLLKNQPRARKVIETVGAMADWGRWRDGRALGLAYSDAFDVHVAQVAEVSLDRASGPDPRPCRLVRRRSRPGHPAAQRGSADDRLHHVRREPCAVRADQHQRRRGAGNQLRQLPGDAHRLRHPRH